MPEKQFAEFERRGAIPGHFNKVTPGGLDRVREREPKNPPVAIIQAEQQATEDYTAEKAYRIEGENGQQFVTINEQVVQQDPIAGTIDAVSKLGIPADLIFDTVIDLSDLPKKNDIKLRWQQQQQMLAQIQIEKIKNRDFRQTISFKDAPFPIQLAMAAKAGYVAQEVADYFMQLMVQQLAPQLVAQMQMQAQPPFKTGYEKSCDKHARWQ